MVEEKVKLKWKGTRLPKIVNVPIPYVMKSKNDHAVVCDPIGVFSQADAEELLKVPDLWEVVHGSVFVPPEMPLCQCKCGERIVWKESYRWAGPAKYVHGHYNAMRKGLHLTEGQNANPALRKA